MKVDFFIARRYSKSKKRKNVIHLITWMSVLGVAISTAALVILLSAFNGIEALVENLYSDFDASLNIHSVHSKTFNQNFLPIEKIKSLPEVSNTSRALKEIVILKNKDKWVHAKMIGVDSSFLSMAKMKEHIIDGNLQLYDSKNRPLSIFGVVLLSKLEGYVSNTKENRCYITFNVPLRNGKIRPGKSPFNTRKIGVSTSINYNREVNSGMVIIPYSIAKGLLEYGDDITSFLIKTKEGTDNLKMKKKVQSLVGDDFIVKTNLEKNELIFKTSKTERLIVYFILLFIFILSSFNLIASITMLFVEKKDDITTLHNMGAKRKTIFNIFFFEGLIIVVKGVIIGLIIGYGITFSQIYFHLIQMPNAPGEFFPMVAKWSDFILILFSVSILGFVISYFPMRILIKRHQSLNPNYPNQ